MNQVFFDKKFESINHMLSLTQFEINREGFLSNSIRCDFENTLKDIFLLLEENKEYLNRYHKNLNNTVNRIVSFDKIDYKIIKIKNSILDLPTPKYFTYKLKNDVIPVLRKQLCALDDQLGSEERLPFSIGQERDDFYEEVKNAIECKKQDYIDVEREYFHLLGNFLDEKKLDSMTDIDFYTGSLELYSLISWSHILRAWIKEGDEAEKEVGDHLLKMIEKSIPLSIKLSFIHQHPDFYELGEFSTKTSYYRDLEKVLGGKSSRDNFLSKYSLKLKQRCSIPLKVLENELASDILEAIDRMDEGQSQIFVLGIRSHRVTIQINCMKLPAADSPAGEYQYKIFNTGSGVSRFHYIEKELVHPLVFRNIPKHALDYFFFYDLIDLALASKSIETFYDLHDSVLVEMGGAEKDFYSEPGHFIQKRGTCSYSSVEAWINSYLTSEQIEHLRHITALYSTSKQRKVVSLLEEDLRDPAWKSANKSQSLLNQIITKKESRLKDSYTLLKLGEEYLNRFSYKNL